MSARRTIDFGELGGPVYAGRPRGELARKHLGLDQMDESPAHIEVRIPETTYSLNSSFFLGLFGPSVVRFKTRNRFLEKYHFTAPDFVMQEVEEGIERALVEVSPL
jgi:hypothetical protein